MNFATDLPPLIDDLERVTQLPDADTVEDLQQQVRHQEEVLLRVKDYLVYLFDQRDKVGTGGGDPTISPTGGDAGAIAAAVIQELQLKRAEWVLPINQELDQLNAQRQILEREIYRLNQQYQTVLGEFPKQLLSHFQDLLQTHLSKAVELFEQRLRYISSVTHSIPGMEDAGFAASEAQLVPEHSPSDHLQSVQKNLDQSLSSLDSTIRAVFTSLEQDIAAYHLSLSDDLRQLHGLRAKQETYSEPGSPLNLGRSPDSDAPAPVILPTPEPPEVESLLALETEPSPPPALVAREPEEESAISLWDDAFSLSESAAERDGGGETTEAIADAGTESVQESYLDFAASVAEEGLFGEDIDATTEEPEPEIEPTVEPTAVPAESFLFGDPVAPPEPEPQPDNISDLKSVIATPMEEQTAQNPEAESTTVKTIQLLTDLLEDGALNIQEEPEEPVADPPEDFGAVEDLSPDLESEELDSESADVTVLDPEKLNQLAEDLTRFESADGVIDVESHSDDSGEAEDLTDGSQVNPWDDAEKTADA